MTDLAVNLICTFEGFREKSYQDIAGVWTIGYGTTMYPGGQKVGANETCTIFQAQQYLLFHLQQSVYPLLKPFTPLPQKILAALCSLIYNVGHIGESIQSVLKVQMYDKLSACFMKYVYVNGVVSIPLVNRRKAEVAFFADEIKQRI